MGSEDNTFFLSPVPDTVAPGSALLLLSGAHLAAAPACPHQSPHPALLGAAPQAGAAPQISLLHCHHIMYAAPS